MLKRVNIILYWLSAISICPSSNKHATSLYTHLPNSLFNFSCQTCIRHESKSQCCTSKCISPLPMLHIFLHQPIKIHPGVQISYLHTHYFSRYFYHDTVQLVASMKQKLRSMMVYSAHKTQVFISFTPQCNTLKANFISPHVHTLRIFYHQHVHQPCSTSPSAMLIPLALSAIPHHVICHNCFIKFWIIDPSQACDLSSCVVVSRWHQDSFHSTKRWTM